MRTPKPWKSSHTSIVLVVVTLAALTGPPALAGAASSTGDTSAPAKGGASPHPAPPIYSPPRSEPRTQLGNFLPSSPPKPAVTQAAGSPLPGSASRGTAPAQPQAGTVSGSAPPTAAPSSSTPPNPLGGRSPTATEIVAARTANSRSYDNHDGTTTTVFANNLNYVASPGNWQPVDLSFRPAGTGFVEDHSAATVRMTAAGIESTDPRSGAGIRFATPALPSVSGHAARAVLDGTSWVFQPTGQGVDFSTIINSRRGAATYTFSYQLLGGAGALGVDPQGELVSNDSTISRASVVGSNGRAYVAGGWRLLPGDVAAFSFDDSALPDSAFPYLIDPAQTGVWTSNTGAPTVNGSGYPPQASVQSFDGSSWIAAADNNNHDGTYGVADAAVYWTTTLDNRAVTVSGSLYLASCQVAHDDNESLYADWVTGLNQDSGLYPQRGLSSTNALTAVPLSSFSNANPNPTACIQGTSTEAQVYNLPLSTLSGFVHYASNGIRFRVGNQAAWRRRRHPRARTTCTLLAASMVPTSRRCSPSPTTTRRRPPPRPRRLQAPPVSP